MKKSTFTTLAALVSLCLTGLPAKADLLQLDSPRFGADSLTLDTRTGLTWLDLPFTLDHSYLEAEAATQPGGPMEGFRHATAQEVLSLYSSAGFQPGFIAQSSPSFQTVASLLSLVGQTDVQNGMLGAAGLTDTLERGGSVSAVMTYGFQSGIPGYFVTALPGPGTTEYGLETAYPSLGNWMVEVPEPSTGALLLAAAALGAFVPKRKS
jgi:hypothetical protein